MADFVIVIASVAALAAPAMPGSAAPAPASSGAAAASVPLNAPTVGFRTYPDAGSCEQATAALVAPCGARLVCLPVEPHAGDLASAY